MGGEILQDTSANNSPAQSNQRRKLKLGGSMNQTEIQINKQLLKNIIESKRIDNN